MKNLVEVIKENKKVIIKRTIVVLGTIAGLAVVGYALRNKDTEESEVTDFSHYERG